MANSSMVSYMKIELDSSAYNRSSIKCLTPKHKRICLEFIQAERNFLDQPEEYGVHCDNLVANLNATGQLQHSKAKWLEAMMAWKDSVKENYNVMTTPNSTVNSALSAEDEELMQHIHENKLWADPSIEQINLVIHYLETNPNASDLWSTISIELDHLSNTKRTETFWKQAFRRIVKRLKAKQQLIDKTEEAGYNLHLNSLTKLEQRLLRAIENAETDDNNSLQAEKSKKNPSLEHLQTHCRICLASQSSKMTHLFANASESNSSSKDISFLEKLNYSSCLSIEAHENDGFPQYICMSCSVLLESTYQLKLLCSKTEKRLQELLLLNEGNNIDENQQKELIDSSECVPPAEFNEPPQKCDAQICTEENYDLTEEYIIEFDDVTNRVEEGTNKLINDEDQIILEADAMQTVEMRDSKAEPKSNRMKSNRKKSNHTQIQTNSMTEEIIIDKLNHKYGCAFCNSQFASIAGLQDHSKRHKGEDKAIRKKVHTCPHCPKRFRARNTLTVHIRSHTGERPYSCEICEKAFKTTSAIANHRAVHSETKAFKCSQCSYTTSTKANLKVHDRTHSGAQPYECGFCTFKFSTASNMVKHMRNIHEKQKANKCDQCNRSFFTRESLRKHSVIHTGLKPFVCPKCKLEYSWYNGLKKHVRQQHANENVQILTEKSYFDQLQHQISEKIN